MQKHFVIIGVSDLGEVGKAVASWISLRGSHLQIVLIADAAVGEGREPDIDAIVSPFTEFGHSVVSLDTGSDKQELHAFITQADVILITGGNTFWLMDRLRKADLVDAIRRRVEDGAIFVGESAGIVAAAADIGFAAPIDDPAVVDDGRTDGLGILPFRVLPHIDHPLMGPAVRDLAASPEDGDIHLKERDLLMVSGGECRVVSG